MRILHSLVLAATIAAVPASGAHAADYLRSEPGPAYVEGLVPACTDPRVLGQVEDQFEHGARHMLGSDVTVAEFADLTEKAYFPRTDNASIERRYCQGSVVLSDQQRHVLYYRVSYPQGYAAYGWKAEGCVLGLDRWYIYGANCSSLRRF